MIIKDREKAKTISYYNQKGRKVTVLIKRHAVLAFRQRYEKLFNKAISAVDAEAYIIYHFPYADRVKNFSPIEKARTKKYNAVTLIFRDIDFSYIVQDGMLMTVEISRRGHRHLNKEGNNE